MMVVVPRLAPGRDRQPRHVARLIARVVVTVAEEVTDRVDRERGVVHEEDPRRAAPQQPLEASGHGSGERDPEPEGGGQAEQHPEHEGAIDEANPRIVEQVAGVALLVGHLHVGEHPPDMGVEEAAQGATPAAAVTDMRAVRVAGLIGEVVVLAVGGHPVDDRTLGGGGPQRGERRSRQAVALEASVGEQAVKADRDPGPDGHVTDGEDQQVLPLQQVAHPSEVHGDQNHERRHSGDHPAGHTVDERHRDRAHELLRAGRRDGRRGNSHWGWGRRVVFGNAHVTLCAVRRACPGTPPWRPRRKHGKAAEIRRIGQVGRS